MRTIHHLTAAFQLLDSYSKGPVTGATILVDGQRVPYVARGDGTYVFSNLLPTPHTYEISAPGCRSVCRTLPPAPKHVPEVVLMPYAPDSAALTRISYFRIRFLKNGAPLPDRTPVQATLLTPVGGLRLVEKAEKGSWTVALAGNYAAGMLYQYYCTQKNPAVQLMITGYDRAYGTYTLQEPLEDTLLPGTLLCPVWELETDRDGVDILPAPGVFFQREEVEFMFRQGGQEQCLVTPLPHPSMKATIIFTA